MLCYIVVIYNAFIGQVIPAQWRGTWDYFYSVSPTKTVEKVLFLGVSRTCPSADAILGPITNPDA